MADISLPGLTPDNPRNHLSDSARRRISDAYLEGEKIRWRALAGVEARYRSESDPEDAFFEYCEKGPAALEINQANLESARLILSALLREYRAAGKSGWEIRQIMDDELDGLASSAELTAIERRMVGLELDLYRMTPTEDLLPDAIRERVRAGLLRIHSKRLERAKLLDCLRDVYDLYASELAKGGEPLTDSLLMDSIPVWVFRAAVDQKWIPYPLIRPITGVVESLLEGWYNPSHYEVVPHKELPETFGGCKVTKGYAAWFTRNLDSRIEYWRSAAKPRAEAGGRRQPEQTGDMVPKPDAEAPAPPETVANTGDGISTDRRAANWEDVQIRFLSDKSVQVYVEHRAGPKYNFAELGFEDGRTQNPNKAWNVLKRLAELKGTIRTEKEAGMEWRKLEKQMQEIRKLLRRHFSSISVDPLPFVRKTGYRARFSICCSPSYDT